MTNRSLIIINAYLEEIKELASELADMSPRTQIEIVALCKSICLKVDKVLEAHEEDLQIIHAQLIEINTVLEEIRALINPAHLAVIDERLEALESSILLINESIATINTTLSTHTTNINNNTQAIQALQNSKQDVLTAGDNITIENNVISASGGEVHLYEHRICAIGSSGGVRGVLFFVYIDNTNTPCTVTKIEELIYGNKENARECYFRDSNGTEYHAIYTQSNMSNAYVITGIQSNSSLTTTFAWGSENPDITDTIRQIL